MLNLNGAENEMLQIMLDLKGSDEKPFSLLCLWNYDEKKYHEIYS